MALTKQEIQQGKKAGVPPGLSAVWAAMLSGGDRGGVADALGGRRESSEV